jgi:hypothetical protein
MEEGHTQGVTYMASFSITALKDFDISQDGRKVVLNFADENDMPVSLKMSTMGLEALLHEITFALTKAHELSDISKQGIVPILRPSKFRADLQPDKTTVVLSFAVKSGLELHYGLEPTHANAFAQQIQDAAQRGMRANPPSRH